jgi:N-acetylglucosaminyldiphosphoundecaprenol N-acetyl-beta-D-mannosaminyltransferase
MDQTVGGITQAINNKEPYNVVTVNPELIMAATKNSAFKDIIAKADVVTPDGIGLLMMGQLTGRRLKERVTGVDLCDRLAKEASQHGWKIYLLGAGPGIAQQSAANLQKKYPKLKIVGTSGADPDPNSAHDIKNDIIAAKPAILLVAYGSPTQELWIQKHRQELDPIVTIGVGGSFDFISGSTKRAPKLVQKIGLEWLWRLVLQPWRIKRILVLPKFAILSLFK